MCQVEGIFLSYGSSKAALEQLSHILAAEKPSWHVYSLEIGAVSDGLATIDENKATGQAR